MDKKKSFILRVATMSMAYAVIASTSITSLLWIGEPQLPKKLDK